MPYEEQKKRGFGFANPQNRLYSFHDGTKLVGFINLFEEETEVFFGIGVSPKDCGRGYGQQMTRKACEISQRLFAGKPIYLEVRTWNTRAVKCYEKAGFRREGLLRDDVCIEGDYRDIVWMAAVNSGNDQENEE